MGVSTTRRQTRAEQCKKNAQARSAQKRQAAFDALQRLQLEHRVITKAAVARQAGVSVVFLRKHPDLVQAIEGAEKTARVSSPSIPPADSAKDQVIAALRRRLEDMKLQLADKDKQLRQKQRDIDRLYGKLAQASPLADAELRCALADALERLAPQETPSTEMD